MKLNHILLLAILLIGVVLVSGCVSQEKGPTCVEGWKCKNNSVQAFQKTDCSWASEKVCDLGCENNVCKIPPKTEIRARVGDTETVIAPSNNSFVKGIVTITMTHVPDGTKMVAFAIQGQGIEDMSKTGPNLGMDNDGSNGWSYIFDTTRYNNSVYDIYAFASSVTEVKEGMPPLGYATAQIVIQN